MGEQHFQDMGDHQTNLPLLQHYTSTLQSHHQDLVTRLWIESKKLWYIVGPSIFSRVTSYSILVISQAFAGHLNDLDLAAFSIAVTVVIGFDMGLMVYPPLCFHPLLCFSNLIFVFQFSWEWQALWRRYVGRRMGRRNTTCWECICSAHGSFSSYAVFCCCLFSSLRLRF